MKTKPQRTTLVDTDFEVHVNMTRWPDAGPVFVVSANIEGYSAGHLALNDRDQLKELRDAIDSFLNAGTSPLAAEP